MGLLVVGFFGMFFLGALYLQEILGYSPLEVGLAFLPSCIVMGTLSLRLRGAADHGLRRARGADRGPGVRQPPGCCCSRARRSTAPTSTDILPVMLLLGTGAGLAFPALMTLAMSGATQSDSGLASGLVNTTVQVGGRDRPRRARDARDRAHRRAARRRRVDATRRSTPASTSPT